MAEDILIVISTYNRASMLLRLLEDINREVQRPFKVLIYNDGSTEDYSQVSDYLRKEMRNSVYKIVDHHGKKKYYKLNGLIYRDLISERFRYFIQMPDDVRLVKNFGQEVISRYHASRVEVLNILITTSFWDLVKKENMNVYKQGSYSFVNKTWVDMCYITTREVLSRLRFIFPVVADSWFSKRSSSGCGTALTRALTDKGARIAISAESLVLHDDHQSMMNPKKYRNYSRKSHV